MSSDLNEYLISECRHELGWVKGMLEGLNENDRIGIKLIIPESGIGKYIARIYRNGEWYMTIQGEDAKDLLCLIRVYIDGVESAIEIINDRKGE